MLPIRNHLKYKNIDKVKVKHRKRHPMLTLNEKNNRCSGLINGTAERFQGKEYYQG